jgi:hypothetical protein
VGFNLLILLVILDGWKPGPNFLFQLLIKPKNCLNFNYWLVNARGYIMSSNKIGRLGMSLIEQKYNEALDRMSGAQRVERTFSLFGSICEMLTLQVSKEFSSLTERELRKKVAERLYLSDRGAQELLKKVRVI